MPQIGDIKIGTQLGLKVRARYIYLACPHCGYERYTRLNSAKKRNLQVYCSKYKCQQIHYAEIKRRTNPLYWDGNGTPILGMKTQARIIGMKGNMIYAYDACPQCQKQLWRQKRNIGKLCQHCKDVALYSGLRGDKNGAWTGGRHINRNGYMEITIQPDDAYYSMSDKGKILEHRYLYAKDVAHRLLETWEIVHHKGDKYQQGSAEDKLDNRLENLELRDASSHFPESMLSKAFKKLQREHKELQARVTLIEAENTLLRKQIGELNAV